MAPAAMRLISPSAAVFLVESGLVEEAAAFQEPRALLRGYFDVAGRQEKHLVGNTLHAAVERVRQAAGKVDQPLREILVGALEIEDDGNRLLELVRDLLRVIEAARDDEMDAHRGGSRNGRNARPEEAVRSFAGSGSVQSSNSRSRRRGASRRTFGRSA